ncbi:MAG: hypothetical protein QG594_1264 [Bacteroidota bacterium]|nr:hypothetical protein [Bacteroidota bacterium]
MKKIYTLFLILFLFSKTVVAQAYLGEIRLTSFNYAPKGWALCNGQLLPIAQNQALFSLLGTTYGGNGTTTFALPDYRGRAAVSADGTTATHGTPQGTETTTLTLAQLPAHSHNEPLKVSNAVATANIPVANASIASPLVTVNGVTREMFAFNNNTPDTPLLGSNSTNAGTAAPTAINVMQPYTVMTYIIALQGIFPSAN